MYSLSSFFTSSIGRKSIVALTGLALFGFVLGHLIGNLQIFLGPEPLNQYAQFLQNLGELLWIIRASLLVMLLAHVYFTIQLRTENRAARPTPYAVTKYRASTRSARLMTLSGLTVLCFIIFHLLHFTAQKIDPSFASLHDSEGRHDVYQMIIHGFQNRPVSAFYLLSVALLALHLNHGFASLFQTLGLNSAKLRPFYKITGSSLSILIFLGYASIPLAVLTGFLK